MSLLPETRHEQRTWQLWNGMNSHVDTDHLIHLLAINLATPEDKNLSKDTSRHAI